MMKRWIFVLLAIVLPFADAMSQDTLRVVGTVINGADGNVLPLCRVQLLKGKTCVAEAYSDYAGNYKMKKVPSGSYTFLVTQFGDTLMRYYGLRLERDTWVRSVVMPPSEDELSDVPYYDAGWFRYLRPVLVVGQKNMLQKMGLLITSPHDPRLWDFNYRDGMWSTPARDASAAVSDPESNNRFLRYNIGLTVSGFNSPMKNSLLLYGRILDAIVPAPTVPWEIVVPDTTDNSGD